MKVSLFSLLCILQSSVFVHSDGGYELQQLIVVSRHGDRKPIYYPNDPYNNYWKTIPQTKLTKNGIRRSFKVGEEIRRAYKSFLPSERRDVFAKSQDSDVCIESAQTILAALFPPQGPNVWNPDLIWQPLAIHTQPVLTDNALAVFARCPAAELAQNKVLESKEVESFLKNEAEFLEYVSEKSGLEVNNVIAANALFDTLSTEKDGGFKLPSWVTDDVYNHLKKFSDLYNTITSTPTEVKRLRGGPLLKLIVDRLNMVNRVYLKVLMKKVSLFSTQGQIIATLLNTLNVSNELAPPISAVLLFELHENKESSQYFVKISYFNETSIDDRHTLYLPGCYYQEYCPLNLFVEISEKMIPDDWENECQLPDSKSKSTNQSPNVPGLPKIPGFPKIPGLPKTPGLPNIPGLPKKPNSPNVSGKPNIPGLPKIPGLSKPGTSKKSKSKGPNVPYLPSKPNNVLKDSNAVTSPEPSKAILIIPILGYALLGAFVLLLISGFIFYIIKLNRRSLYEIV